MKKLIGAVEIAVLIVALSGGIDMIVRACGKYARICGVLYFCAFIFTLHQATEDSRDEGIEACQSFYKGRIGETSYKKLTVICRVDGTEQTIYQNSVKMGSSTYFGPSGGCEGATDCTECKQCLLNATMQAFEE